ncbi:MAG: RNA 2',3'-cyclic phosphodiesterase [Candidatus Azambacteria bacterium]|nr:RNA 2',3'-cyclic phosphodiesterase [Candidatus Azambacteria bacterium]
MTKRLFISIMLPSEWQSAFANYYAQFSARDVRWTPKEDIHITSCFLGDVEEARVNEIKEKIKELCAQTKSFSLSFEKITFAPPGMPPRMVWAVFQESDAYERLVENMQKELRGFLAVEPHEETIPHATLARFKDPALAQAINVEKTLPELASFDVHSVELVESCLDPAGVRYKTLETFSFGKAV